MWPPDRMMVTSVDVGALVVRLGGGGGCLLPAAAAAVPAYDACVGLDCWGGAWAEALAFLPGIIFLPFALWVTVVKPSFPTVVG